MAAPSDTTSTPIEVAELIKTFPLLYAKAS